MLFAKLLKVYREDRNLSRRQLSKELGGSPNVISQIEHGMFIPTDEKIVDIGHGLQLDLDQIKGLLSSAQEQRKLPRIGGYAELERYWPYVRSHQ